MIRRQTIKKDKKKAQTKVTFVLPYEEERGRTYVVGDFNNWKVGANLLRKRNNGTASVAVTLRSGERFAFRYVTEGGHWFNDEAADDYEHNGIDGMNCVVLT